MSEMSEGIRISFARSDEKRNAGLHELDTIDAYKDIPYADGWIYNLLDVYRPKGIEGELPVIVSIHGGGYVYGTKEVYKYYAMFLASQGFVVLNFNYHLAPELKFPTQLAETNMVLEWMVEHRKTYGMDLKHVFLAGDSAGAQLASHFCTIYSNPDFAQKFSFEIPKEIVIKAVALNCGMYDISVKSYEYFEKLKEEHGMDTVTLLNDYIGEERFALDEMFQVEENITSAFPPAYIMTAQYDFLKNLAKPMYELLKSKGVQTVYKLYGEEGQTYMGHVFHCNMHLQEAEECNIEECRFFSRYLS